MELELVIVGGTGVGKTSYINLFITGEFEQKYNATQGVSRRDFMYQTNKGDIKFKTIEYAGQKIYSNPEMKIKTNTCALVMFDVTSKL